MFGWKDEFCSCDDLKKIEWGTHYQYGLDVCGFCLKPFLTEDYVTDEIIAWRQQKNQNLAAQKKSDPSSVSLSQILIPSIVVVAFVIVLLFALPEIRNSQESSPQESISQPPSVTSISPQPLGEFFGQTPIQYNFGIGCDRLRAQIYEGTAEIFREAGTMGEEDGDLDLALIAYRYADALESFDQTETFEECNYR